VNRIKLIARREFLAVIGSPTGVVTLGVYLMLAGYVFALHVTGTQEATLRYTFSALGMMTVFVVPLITMRLLSEEMRSGTFEVLTSHPVTDVQIVIGKFLAGWAAFLVLSAPTLSYVFILQVFGSPDWGPALCGYLGQQLMAALLIAMGLFVSATTSSQVLAALVAMVGGVLLRLAGSAALSVQGWLGDALAYLALFNHFSLFRRGVLDSRAVIYFAGTAVMFLYLAVRAVESRRWKFGVVPGGVPGEWRHPRISVVLLSGAAVLAVGILISRVTGGIWSLYHAGVLVLAVALAAIPALLNRTRLRYQIARRQAGVALTVAVNSLMVIVIWALATFLTSRHFVRLDLTSSKHYALSPQTLSLLERLATPVEFEVAVTQPADLRNEVEDLLSEYKGHSGRVSVNTVDPVRQPAEAERIRQRYKLTSPLADEVIVGVEDRCRRIPVSAFVRQRRENVQRQEIRGPIEFVGESEMTAALIQLTRTTPGRVVFLSGHGEKDPHDSGNNGISTVAAELRRAGWQATPHIVTPGVAAEFPSNTAVVVVAGPQKELSNEDLHALQSVLDRGGGVLCLLDPALKSGLEPLLNPWDIRLTDDIVMDLEDHIASADPTGLYVTRFTQDHPIGKGMGTLAAVLPAARRVAMNARDTNPSVFAHSFMLSSGNGWAVSLRDGTQHLRIDKQRDKRGPISLGVACERSQPSAAPGRPPLLGRLVVIGNSAFIVNQYVDMAGNMNLFLNCVDWLAGRQDLISVRPKFIEYRMIDLTRRQAQGIYWLSVLVVPGVTMLIGAWILRRRKRNV